MKAFILIILIKSTAYGVASIDSAEFSSRESCLFSASFIHQEIEKQDIKSTLICVPKDKSVRF